MPTHGIRLQNIPVTSPTRSAITPISHGITIAPIPATGSITPRLVAFISPAGSRHGDRIDPCHGECKGEQHGDGSRRMLHVYKPAVQHAAAAAHPRKRAKNMMHRKNERDQGVWRSESPPHHRYRVCRKGTREDSHVFIVCHEPSRHTRLRRILAE